MTNEKEQFILSLQARMMDVPTLEREHIQKMLDIVREQIQPYKLELESTEIIPAEDAIPASLREYIAVQIMTGKSKATVANYKLTLVNFALNVGKRVELVTTNDIIVYLYKYQESRGCSVRTMDAYRGVISTFYQWMHKNGKIPTCPTDGVPRYKFYTENKKALTRRQLLEIEAKCKTPFEKALILFLSTTGCRISEATNAKLSDIDWDRREIRIIGKGNKPRFTWFSERAEIALREYINARHDDCPYLFIKKIKPHGKFTTSGLALNVDGISDRIGELVNFPVTPHTYRRTAATLALAAGMNVTQVQHFLGHSNVSTTMRYLDITEDDIRTAHYKFVV